MNRPLVVVGLSIALSACAATPVVNKPSSEEERVFGGAIHRQDGLVLRYRARAPEGMAAFYLGRGFPKTAVDEARQACFISFYVRNERPDKVWFDLSRWSFTDRNGQPIRRLTRPHWDQRWERMKVPMRFRATFGWTMAPELRDLHTSEPVAGNVTLVPVPGPIRVIAEFPTGENRDGPVIRFQFEGLSCPRDPA